MLIFDGLELMRAVALPRASSVARPSRSETAAMREVLEPTPDPGWTIGHEGYNVLTESAVESRLAFGNGFLGMRAARSAGRGPTWRTRSWRR